MEKIIILNDIEYKVSTGVKVKSYTDAMYEIEDNGKTYYKVCRWVDIMDKNIKEVYYIKEINNTRSSGI
jgi:hypothetical protein